MRAIRRPNAPREKGFALLIVLWSLALLALIGTRVTSAGRTETQIARNLRDAAVAEAAADGIVHEAVFHLLDRSPARWVADGRWHRLTRPGGIVDLRMVDAGGRLNPNTAPPPLMAALSREIGVDPRTAEALAAAIFDWRTPGAAASPLGAKTPRYLAAGRAFGPSGQRFASLDELGAVMGMTPEILAALRPYLSLYNFGPIEPAHADPVLRRALAAAAVGQPADDEEPQPAVLVEARVTLADGASFTRRATLMPRPGPDGRPFRTLTWESGPE